MVDTKVKSSGFDVTIKYRDGGEERHRNVIGTTFRDGVLIIKLENKTLCVVLGTVTYWTEIKEEK